MVHDNAVVGREVQREFLCGRCEKSPNLFEFGFRQDQRSITRKRVAENLEFAEVHNAEKRTTNPRTAKSTNLAAIG